ncbi:MAG: hypothetical protein ACI4SH_06680, partial [Candidatus Scatosoma sp.]
TDEFHTLAISMKGLTCTVYLDGVQFASFDCYAGNAWGNVGTTFALGGAAGVGGTAGGSAYFKYFDVYDFAMSGSELSALNRGQLNLTEAAYISSAAEVSSAVTVIKNTPNDEILAESPTVSDVTVTLSDGSTPTAKAIWTGVEKQGDNVYLVGTILAAGASNPNGVKARMPVTFVAQAKEVSLTLDGTIGLNYYFSLIDTVVAEESEAVLIWKAEDNSVLGTVELKGYTVKGTESKTDWYKFTYAVAAKDYKNKITAEISDGETVLESVTFSAEDYFTVVESGEYEEKLKTLVSATKNYCEAARAFFANESVTENESAVTVSDEYKISAEGVLPEGISNVTVSMVLESDTELRVYFKAASIDGIAFTIDGAEAIPVKSGSYYYLSLKNVTATQLSVRHAFTIGSFTVRYGALSYVNEVLTIENPETVYANVAAWKNVVKAIYAYSAAAQNYFA